MRLIAGLTCLLFLAPTPVRAQTPTPAEEILRLVPDDMALCLVVQDLRGYSDKFQKSNWYQILNQSPLGSALFSSKEFGAIAKFEAEITKHLGVTWAQLRDEIFGDAVAFAFRHGTSNDDEQGLVLLKAKKPELLAQIVDRVNDDQQKRGDLKELRRIEFKGQHYVRRIERGGEHFYAIDGGFFAFSGREEVLHRVLELRAKERSEAPVLAKMKR